MRVTPAAPGAARARQVGPDVVLVAPLNARRTDGAALADGAAVNVLRMVALPALRPGAVSERYLVQQFLRAARPVGVITGDDLRLSANEGRLRFVDRGAASAIAGGEVGAAYLYGLQVVEPDGGRSPMRSPVLVETGAPPPPPGALRAEVAEGEIRLQWEAPASGPAVYNVYRKGMGEGREPDAPLNPAPLDEPGYVDRSFVYDAGYVYHVRTIDRGRATPCESVPGPAVELRPHDRFPPAVPTGVAVAVEGGQIRIYWFPNAEADLAGYRIYRRADESIDAGRVGEVGAGESAFVDGGAEPGVRYHYAVSAIDGATPANESARSVEQSERLPPAVPSNPPPGGGARE